MKFNLFIKKILCSTAVVLTMCSLSLYTSAIQLDFSVESVNYEHSTEINQSNEIADATLMSEDFEGDKFENGLGTEESPYIISTAEELMSIPYYVNSGKYRDAYYKLANDIDLAGSEWTPIGTLLYPFTGSFDGNGKTVSNFKITEAHTYNGFFGFVKNASVSDLTVSNVKIKFSYITSENDAIYIGVIISRIDATDDTKDVVIKNCHVYNTEIDIENNYRIYGSGHTGYLSCSQNANVIFSNCTTNAVCNFNLQDQSNDASRSFLRIGGLLSFAAFTDGGKAEVFDCASNATIISNFTNISKPETNNTYIGAFAGYISLSSSESDNKCSLKLYRCYSTNMVYTNTDGGTHVGGFVGYLVSSAAIASISDCHTSSNVYAQSKATESYYLAGFVGLAGVQNGGEITVENCYATGNVIAIRQKNARGRRFVSVIVGEPIFNNCFATEEAVVVAEHKLTYYSVNEKDSEKDLPEKVLNADSAADLTEYTGFDINVWESGEAPYKYPVLINNKLVHGSYSAYYYLNNKLVKYQDELAYGDYPNIPDVIPDSHYIFSHWSTYPGNPDTLDEEYGITSDVVLFPNDSTEPKSYTITFMSLGKVYDTKSLKYNTEIEVPEPPATYESADKLFKYAFSHWSVTENGEAISKNFKITGEKTLYAVFKKLDLNVWDGVSSMSISIGNGTKDNPYQISNAYHLAFLSQIVNSGKATSASHYVITEDIDLGSYEWTPIGTEDNPFAGSIDGNGYSIYNFEISDVNTKYAGLFGYVKNSEISNLDVSDFTINIQNNEDNSYYAGGIAAYMESKGIGAVMSIEQCRTDGSISIKSHIAHTGGLVGFASDSPESSTYIHNSYSECDITLNTAEISTAGGVVSYIICYNPESSFINKVYFTGNISAVSSKTAISGGIIGLASLSENSADVELIENSFFAGNKVESVSSTDDSYSGAIYGQLKFENDENFADITLELNNCSYIESAEIKGENIISNETATKISDITDLYDSETLSGVYEFDCESIWSASDDALPLLKIICRPKDKFIINKYDIINNKLEAELTVCFKDIDKYLVLVGVYNSRGKMIGFDSILVNNASELQKVTVSIPGASTAATATISLINPANLHYVRPPQIRILTLD